MYKVHTFEQNCSFKLCELWLATFFAIFFAPLCFFFFFFLRLFWYFIFSKTYAAAAAGLADNFFHLFSVALFQISFFFLLFTFLSARGIPSNCVCECGNLMNTHTYACFCPFAFCIKNLAKKLETKSLAKVARGTRVCRLSMPQPPRRLGLLLLLLLFISLYVCLLTWCARLLFGRSLSPSLFANY